MGQGSKLNSTCMRKRRAYSRRNTQLSCLEMIHAPRLYQALREMLRLFPSWANPKIGSAPANGVDTPQGVVRPSMVAIRYVLELSILPQCTLLVTAGLRELKTLAA